MLLINTLRVSPHVVFEWCEDCMKKCGIIIMPPQSNKNPAHVVRFVEDLQSTFAQISYNVLWSVAFDGRKDHSLSIYNGNHALNWKPINQQPWQIESYASGTGPYRCELRWLLWCSINCAPKTPSTPSPPSAIGVCDQSVSCELNLGVHKPPHFVFIYNSPHIKQCSLLIVQIMGFRALQVCTRNIIKSWRQLEL